MPDPILLGPVPRSVEPINEAGLVQNTALGAILIWRFAVGYETEANRPSPVPAAFLVLPILFYHHTRDAAIKTQKASSLSTFCSKFDGNREELLAIHDRMLALRQLSLRAMTVAVSQKLVGIMNDDATLSVIQTKNPPRSAPERVRPMISAAEKIGVWFGRTTIPELSNMLRVSF